MGNEVRWEVRFKLIHIVFWLSESQVATFKDAREGVRILYYMPCVTSYYGKPNFQIATKNPLLLGGISHKKNVSTFLLCFKSSFINYSFIAEKFTSQKSWLFN